MPENKKLPHLFLKNQAISSEKFKKARGFKAKPPEEKEKKKNYTPQKDRLKEDNRILNIEKRNISNIVLVRW